MNISQRFYSISHDEGQFYLIAVKLALDAQGLLPIVKGVFFEVCFELKIP